MTDSKEIKNNEKDNTVGKVDTTQNSDFKKQADEQKSELADKVGNAVHGDTKAAKDIYNQAKESTGEVAGKVYNVAAKTASSKVDEQKTNLAVGLLSIADNIRQMGDSLSEGEQSHGIAKLTSDYSSTLADKVEQMSTYLDRRDLGELMSDVEDFAHRNPALFLGGAFALGVAAARFLKSGNSNQALMRRPRYERKGEYLPDEHEGVHLPEDLEQKVKDNKDTMNKSANAASSTKGA